MPPPDPRNRKSRDYLGTHELLSIPPEIFFMIAEQLPTIANISLSLTCKGFFTALRPHDTFPQIDRKERLQLLLLLERDVPARFLCFRCKKLVLLDESPGKQRLDTNTHFNSYVSFGNDDYDHGWPSTRYDCDEEEHPPRLRCVPDPLLWEPECNGSHSFQPRLTFSEAQLVMNRHFYGESHGISAKSLESSIEIARDVQTNAYYEPFDHYLRKSQTTPNLQKPASRSLTKQISKTWRFTHRTFAKVIGNNLFICRVHNVVSPPCPANIFTWVVDNLDLPVCTHICGSSGVCEAPYLMNPQNFIPALHSIAMAPYDQRFDTRCDNQITSCTWCFTDYEIHIERGNENEEWDLNLCTYHNLGSCRSPDDDAWSRLLQPVYGYMMDSPDRCRKGNPGDVRLSWLQHNKCEDRGSSGLRAEWALSFYFMTKSWFCTSTDDWDQDTPHQEIYLKSCRHNGPVWLSSRQTQMMKYASETIGSDSKSSV